MSTPDPDAEWLRGLCPDSLARTRHNAVADRLESLEARVAAAELVIDQYANRLNWTWGHEMAGAKRYWTHGELENGYDLAAAYRQQYPAAEPKTEPINDPAED